MRQKMMDDTGEGQLDAVESFDDEDYPDQDDDLDQEVVLGN